jgi:hypothetical protein
MIYHPSEHNFVKLFKILAFWASILLMLWFCILVFHDDIKIPQKEVTLKIDLTNKVNICRPEEN